MAFYLSPMTPALRPAGLFSLVDDAADLFLEDLFPVPTRGQPPAAGFALDLADLLQGRLRGQCRRQDPGFRVAVSTEGFRPEEVKTSVDKEARTVKVSAASERKSEDGAIVSKRSFERTYTLPEGCDMDAVDVQKTDSGMLRITAPAAKKEGGPPEICATEEDFSVCLDLGSEVSPSSLNLELDTKTRQLTVRAGEGRSESFRVPELYDLAGMKSAFDKEAGKLRITAPRRKEDNASVPIAIDIN